MRKRLPLDHMQIDYRRCNKPPAAFLDEHPTPDTVNTVPTVRNLFSLANLLVIVHIEHGPSIRKNRVRQFAGVSQPVSPV